METVRSSEELMEHIVNMNRDNSVYQFMIPGKGTFTLVLQEEDPVSIASDAAANPELGHMIRESRKEYAQRQGMTTADLLNSLSPKDFK